MAVYPRIVVRNFGPFEYANLELKPVTLLIGRNSVGKSMLAYLAWTLASLMPDFDKLAEILTEKGAYKLAREILDEIGRGLNPQEKIRKLFEMHVEALPEALAASLREALQKTFMTRVESLIREGASRATIRVEGPESTLELILEGNKIKVAYHEPYYEFLEKLKISVPKPNKLEIVYTEKGQEIAIYKRTVSEFSDLAVAAGEALLRYVIEAFHLFFTSTRIASLLPDSRAGVARTLLKPYIQLTIARHVSYADEEFIYLYFRLAEMIDKGLVDLDMVEPLLKELGCTLEVVFERGVYTVYAVTWTGKRLPLVQAPSGMRESLTVALALASKEKPYVAVVEEPEAHLHPRAQQILVRLMARSVNSLGKYVLVTTHSDYILYTMNNLIALSQNPDRAEKLGYRRDEILKPDMVATYLVKAEGRRAVLEQLKVGAEGVSEEEFAKIAEELAEERARILA